MCNGTKLKIKEDGTTLADIPSKTGRVVSVQIIYDKDLETLRARSRTSSRRPSQPPDADYARSPASSSVGDDDDRENASYSSGSDEEDGRSSTRKVPGRKSRGTTKSKSRSVSAMPPPRRSVSRKPPTSQFVKPESGANHRHYRPTSTPAATRDSPASSPATSSHEPPGSTQQHHPMANASFVDITTRLYGNKPVHNHAFVKFLQSYMKRGSAVAHYSLHYLHDLAWADWENLPPKAARVYVNSAVRECGQAAMGSQWTKPEVEASLNPVAAAELARPEMDFESQFAQPKEEEPEVETPQEEMPNFQLQEFVADSDPNTLENCVSKGVEFLDDLKVPLRIENESNDCDQWLKQIEALQASAQRTRTIIGVVGNTGAGKSSVINALLEEERYV